jgi:methionyl-tRNA formyltransferase
MNIVFFGTPAYCLPILNKIQKKFKVKPHDLPIAAVITQKPRPVGRKQFITYSAVDTWAFKRKIPVYYTVGDFLKEGIKADLGVVVAYGEILSKEIINYFPHGILNIHPSILPKYRGASPLQAAIAAGEKITGSTIMKIDEKMDHGPIVSQFQEEILNSDNSKSLGDRIFSRSAEVLVNLLTPYLQGKINLNSQDDNKASYTTLLKKEHGYIPPQILKGILDNKKVSKIWKINFIKDFETKPDPISLDNFVRAVSPWPGAWTEIYIDKYRKEQKRLKIIEGHIKEDKYEIGKVQLEGKLEVTWDEFQKGYPDFSF